VAPNRMARLVDAPEGEVAVLQGNIAFAVGCVRGGIHAADGYPGTPSTEVIDKGLRFVQDRMRVGWSVNEANAVALGLGTTMAGEDAVVTMKVPGLFQAGDVVASAAGITARRGGLVLYVATDFVPSSTQHVIDPRYFLKSCFVPVLEPRTHQEMLEIGPLAAALAREHATLVAVVVNGLLCHSEGLVRLNPRREIARVEGELDLARFMNLPRIARESHDRVYATRLPALRALAEATPLNRIEWNDRSLGVVVHGITDLYLREVLDALPVRPSILSLGMTNPVPGEMLRAFASGVDGKVVVLGDGMRFVQEECLALGLAVEGKDPLDPSTEWTPAAIARRLGAEIQEPPAPSLAPIPRPPNICAGCPYRAFGLVVAKLRKKKRIVGSFGDIGCNTLLFFLRAIDTCTCMGASETERQGVVLSDPSMAGRVLSVLGDSTECHSGLDATRNAVFRNVPGVKVILDNATTAMTGGQPAPSSPRNLAGEETRFDLVAAARGEGAEVVALDAYDMAAIESGLAAALDRAAEGSFTVLVIRGKCMREAPSEEKRPPLPDDARGLQAMPPLPDLPGDRDGRGRLPAVHAPLHGLRRRAGDLRAALRPGRPGPRRGGGRGAGASAASGDPRGRGVRRGRRASFRDPRGGPWRGRPGEPLPRQGPRRGRAPARGDERREGRDARHGPARRTGHLHVRLGRRPLAGARAGLGRRARRAGADGAAPPPASSPC
jgi:indolepyruvate ferredoxin oxidoreductase alpha subunit